MATIDPNKLTEEQARQNLAASNLSQTPAQREQAVLDYSATQPGQTVSYAPATGGQTFQAYTSTDASRRDAGIQEVARLNNISLAEAAKRYDRGTASQAGTVTPPPGTVYNPATGKAYDPLSGMEYAGSTGSNFQGMRFVDPGAQGFMGTGMPGQQTGLPASTAMGVPAGASGAVQGQVTEDPEMAFWRTQQEQAKLRLNQTQAALNQQFEQMRREREAQQKSQQGQASMQLARMGAFSAASGVSYGAALQSRHANELQQLEMERQNALLKAQNEADEVGLEFAMKSLERAKELKVEQQKIADRQMQDVERYKRLQAIEKEDLALTMQDMIDGGMTLDDLPEDYLKTKYPNIDDFTAKVLFSTIQKDVEAKNAKTRTEQQKADIENTKNIYSILEKVPVGKTVTIGGVEYTGLEKGEVKTGTETDSQGNVTYWQVDTSTGKIVTTNLGNIGREQDGWETKFDDNGKPWRFNSQTGQMSPFYPGQTQVEWQQKFPEGSVWQRNGKPAPQCGQFANDLTGIGVGDTFESKVSKMNLWKKGQGDPRAVLDNLQVGDCFIQKLGTWTGHIGIFTGYEQAPDGRIMIRALESNYPQPGKVTSTRLVPLDQIDGFGRGSRVSPLLRTGPDTQQTAPATSGQGLPGGEMPTFGAKTQAKKELSLTEIEKINKSLPADKQLPLGATTGDAIAAGYKPGAAVGGIEIPSFDAFAKDFELAASKDPSIATIPPSQVKAIYEDLTQRVPYVMDAAETVGSLLPEKRAESVIKNISKALEKGNIQSAKEQLQNAALSTVSADEQKAIRGRGIGVKQLEKIKGLMEEMESRKPGSTGIFKGTEESIRQKAGTLGDAELRRMATLIASTLIDYRKSVSGAAFTESEKTDYAELFPSVNGTYELNMAKIDGLVESWREGNREFYRTVITPTLYDNVFSE